MMPFRSTIMTVEPAWIDYNGHLNMAYYHVLFDRGLDQAALRIGLGPDYAATGASWFTIETHVRYLREIHENERVTVAVRLVDCDDKRIHWWQELWSEDRAFLSATCETMTVHVDLNDRRVTPFPEPMREIIARWHAEEAEWPTPKGLGRSVGIRRDLGM